MRPPGFRGAVRRRRRGCAWLATCLCPSTSSTAAAYVTRHTTRRVARAVRIHAARRSCAMVASRATTTSIPPPARHLSCALVSATSSARWFHASRRCHRHRSVSVLLASRAPPQQQLLRLATQAAQQPAAMARAVPRQQQPSTWAGARRGPWHGEDWAWPVAGSARQQQRRHRTRPPSRVRVWLDDLRGTASGGSGD